MGRAGPRPMRCGLYMGRSARPMRRPMCFDGPARTAAHEMWCTIATTTTTSTVPMRPPKCFGGPARAVAYEMWCTTATTTTFFGCAWVVIRQKQIRSYDAFLANRRGCKILYYALRNGRIKALLPLWVYRRRSLPSRRRRQHDVLALVRPADETAGATS